MGELPEAAAKLIGALQPAVLHATSSLLGDASTTAGHATCAISLHEPPAQQARRPPATASFELRRGLRRRRYATGVMGDPSGSVSSLPNSGISLSEAVMSTEWSSALAIGIPEIDAQHQELLTLLNEVEQQAAQESPCFQAIDDVFDQLEAYIATHFRDEEALMARIGFEFLAEHCAEHRLLARQVTEFRQAFSTGEVGVHFLHEWLIRWLITHIAGSDTLIADSLHQREYRLAA
jgi:hemerythrin